MPWRDKFKTKEEYNAWFREYRKSKGESYRKKHREYAKAYRKKYGYAAEERAKKKFPLKQNARRMFAYAVKIGKIKRGYCAVCKKPDAQGHHDDYYKPLEVRWFCPLHHAEAHKMALKHKGISDLA
jgi:hypothetical protein